MAYTIISGQYELGTEDQQQAYRQLFGEEQTQYKFDLYFHWYNIVHELGHCLMEAMKIVASDVQIEMFVNEFAVSYWREVGCGAQIEELRVILEEILKNAVSPVPEGEAFEAYFEKIWETEALDDVNTYGYFQFRSVLEAMKYNMSFAKTVSQAGIRLDQEAVIERYKEEINAPNAPKVLEHALANMKEWGLTLPQVELKLVKNPMIQCAQYTGSWK